MKILTAGFLVADITAPDLPNVASPSDVVFTPSSIDLHIGGHPANVSIDLVKLGLDPEKTGVVGAVGGDLFGEFIENSLRDFGLQVFLQKTSKKGTSKNLILTVEGEDRRFHTDAGANMYLDFEHVEKVLEEQKPEFFYTAVGITGIDSKIRDLLKKAKRMGCKTALDLLKPYKKDWDFLIPALEFTDIFHCNTIEALQITRKEKINSALEELLKRGNIKIIAISRGEAGALLKTPDYKISQPSFKVNTKDPSGAGDAFCAGLLRKIMKKGLDPTITDPESLKKILVYGQAAGAIACTAAGTTTAVSKRKVREILGRHEKKIKNNTIIEKE